MLRETVIGAELQNDSIRLVELIYTNEHVLVSQIKIISIPPKTIINGEVNDPGGLADQIMRTLDEMGTEATRILTSVNDNKFFKQLRQFPLIKQFELNDLLQEEVANSTLFFREDFQLGYQSFREFDEFGEKILQQQVLYAAASRSKVDSVQELFDMTGLRLMAVDLPSLSALRFFMYRNKRIDPIISVFIDLDYIDLNIFIGSDVYFTFTIQLQIDEHTDLDVAMEYILSRIQHFLLSYSNYFFNKDMPVSGVYFCRNMLLDSLPSALQDHFPNIVWEKVNGMSIINVDASLTVDEHQLMEYVVPIGVGLKYFENVSKRSLNLILESQDIDPFIDYHKLKVSGVVFVASLLILWIINFYVVVSQDRLSSDLKVVQSNIKKLQSGEFIVQQNKLLLFQSRLKKYNKVRDASFSKTEFLKTLVTGLPEDLSFKTVKLSSDSRVVINAVAFYQDSIYQFYNHLKDSYSNVELSSIVTKYGSDNVPVNSFKVSFRRI